MTDRRTLSPEDRDSLAAEYALGVLDGEDLASARSLLASDPDFAREVARWSGRLAPLLDEVEQTPPPQRLWRSISDRLGPDLRPSAEIHQLRRNVSVWRGISAGAMAIAASLALFLVVQPRTVTAPAPVEQPAQAPPPLVAMIGNDEAAMAMVATWDSANRRLLVAAADPMPRAAGRTHELWVIPADGTPRSLGTMADDPTIRMQVAEPMASELQEGVTLAVSVEPAGGSPTGQPTGPVIASGKLERA